MLYFTAKEIAKASGKPIANIEKNLPFIATAMDAAGIMKLNGVVATVATICTETSFAPIDEIGGDKYFTRMYEGRKDLGNVYQGDGARFHGRGYIQVTGRYNYIKYGKLIGVDLVNNPELAKDPKNAADILCIYLRDHGVDVWAERGHWQKVRKLVNGGTNGLEYFLPVVWKLLDIHYAKR